MPFIGRLRVLAKEALRTGKIVRKVDTISVATKSDNGIHSCTGEQVQSTSLFNTELCKSFITETTSDNNWNKFVNLEKRFRQSISTKPFKSEVTYLHQDPLKWWKVVRHISSLFVKEGVFQQSMNGRDYPTPLLKYTKRILHKYPTETPDLLENDNAPMHEALLCEIKQCLHFVQCTIQPTFKPEIRNRVPSVIDKDRLTQLWQTKQSKAIEIIDNNSKVKPTRVCKINPEKLEKHYNERCQKVLQYPLPQAPWANKINIPPPEIEMDISPFNEEDILKTITTLKSKKAPGFDGVEHQYLKQHKNTLAAPLTSICNICLHYRRVPPDWKHSIDVLIPKTENDSDDPDDWRRISLLNSSYKLFMRLLQKRAMPWIVNTKRLYSKQKGSLPRSGLHEHVFGLQSDIDNFKHLSQKLCITFIDIKDAFGSIDHEIMLNALKLFGYPSLVCDLTRDIYNGSSFQLVTSKGLTKPIVRKKGIIQGCPWSVIVFEQGIDMWLRYATVNTPEIQIPNPIQGYVDDVSLCSTSVDEMTRMVKKTEEFMQYTGMSVKHRKCASLFGQRSGNSWYTGPRTENLSLEIQGDTIPRYAREQTYKYLGHQLNLAGNGTEKQLQSIMVDFRDRIAKIDIAPLPAAAKIQAINTMAISKLLFYFPILHFSEKVLDEIEDEVVSSVRKWLKLNTSCTRSVMFLARRDGGLGILNPRTMYHAKKVAFMVKSLNSDDEQVERAARSSLELHMKKRKVNYINDSETPQFAGYETDGNGKVIRHAKSSWGKSDFIDLNQLCIRMDIKIIKKEDLFYMRMPVDNEITMDLADSDSIYRQIKSHYRDKSVEHWEGLKNQGSVKVNAMPHADMSVSNQHLVNLKLDDKLVMFIVKARLQLLETNALLAVYYPNSYIRGCHLCNHPVDTASHVLNGCMSFNNMYT